MIEYIISALGLLGISNIVTFVLTKKKYNTEVDAQQIENVNKSFDLYKKMMEETLDAQKRSNDAIINGLNGKVDSLQKENETLRAQVTQLQNQYDRLQNQMINFLMGNNLSELKDGLMPLTNILKAD